MNKAEFGVGMRMTLYFAEASSPSIRAAIRECLADYLKQTNASLKCCSVPWSRSWKPFSSKVSDELRMWLQTAPEMAPWDFIATGSENDYAASPFHIEVLAAGAWEQKAFNKLSYITATFPEDWFSTQEEPLSTWMFRWADRLAPRHGFGGLSFYLPVSRAACANMEKEVYESALRYPAIELDYPVNQLRDLSDKLKGVNWLTAVGDDLMRQLDKTERPPSSAILSKYNGGTLIQLGDSVPSRNLTQNDIPENYRELDRFLKPVRVQPAHGWGNAANSGFDWQGTCDLLARFDKA